ncbi:MAG: hypothetical protein J6P47_04980, partial [Acetobacter sp.]|nr:hypothetical protein [Acetobacter sp.]
MVDPYTIGKICGTLNSILKSVVNERDKKELLECGQALLAQNEVLVSGSETLGRATIGLLDQIEDLQNRIEHLKKENIALKASLAICFFIFVVWHFGSIWHWFTSILLSIWHFGISHY